MQLQNEFIVSSAFVYKIKNRDGSGISLHPGDIIKVRLTDGRSFQGVMMSDSVEAFRCLLIKTEQGRLSIGWQMIESIGITGRNEQAKEAWDISEPIRLELLHREENE